MTNDSILVDKYKNLTQLFAYNFRTYPLLYVYVNPKHNVLQTNFLCLTVVYAINSLSTPDYTGYSVVFDYAKNALSFRLHFRINIILFQLECHSFIITIEFYI